MDVLSKIGHSSAAHAQASSSDQEVAAGSHFPEALVRVLLLQVPQIFWSLQFFQSWHLRTHAQVLNVSEALQLPCDCCEGVGTF